MSELQNSLQNFAIRNLQLLYKILVRVALGLYCSQIARQLNLSHQIVSYYMKKLEICGFIALEVKTNFKSYKLTPEGEQLLQELKAASKEDLQKGLAKKSLLYVRTQKQHIRTHNLAFKLKILQDNPEADFSKELGYKEVKKANNNWLAKYFVISTPIGMTIEKTPKHVIVNFHKFYSEPKNYMNDFFSKVWKGLLYVASYFERKYGIILDYFEPEVIRFHLANEGPDLNDKVEEKVQIKVNLGRKAKVIFPASFEAKAWLDRSGGQVEIETNDMLYEEKLLMMPEILYDLNQRWGRLEGLMEKQIYVMSEFTEQIKLHLNVLQKMSDALDKISEKLGKKAIELSRELKN